MSKGHKEIYFSSMRWGSMRSLVYEELVLYVNNDEPHFAQSMIIMNLWSTLCGIVLHNFL